MVSLTQALFGLLLLSPATTADQLWQVPADGPLALVLTLAQDGDTIVLAPGEHGGGSITGGFSIVSEVPGQARFTTNDTIRLCAPSSTQTLTLSGLVIAKSEPPNPFAPAGSAITIDPGDGVVCIENCVTEVTAGEAAAVEIDGAIAIFSGSNLEGGSATAGPPFPFAPGPSFVARDSVCYVDSCQLIGRSGTPGFSGSSFPTPGAAGVRLSNSTFIATNSVVRGGNGGPLFSYPSPCVGGAPGGPAIVVLDASQPSNIELWGTTLVPGSVPCSSSPDAEPVLDLGTVPSSLLDNPRRFGLSAPGVAEPGAQVLVLSEASESFRLVLLGVSTTLDLLELPFNGLPLLVGPSVSLIPLGVTDASGVVQAALAAPQLPAGCDALVIRLQAFQFGSPFDGGLTGVRTLHVF